MIDLPVLDYCFVNSAVSAANCVRGSIRGPRRAPGPGTAPLRTGHGLRGGGRIAEGNALETKRPEQPAEAEHNKHRLPPQPRVSAFLVDLLESGRGLCPAGGLVPRGPRDSENGYSH